MTLQRFLDATTFSGYTDDQEDELDQALRGLYNGSVTFRDEVDTYINAGGDFDFVFLEGEMVTSVGADIGEGNRGKIWADVNYLDGLVYIDDFGVAQVVRLDLALAHEMMHATTNLGDDHDIFDVGGPIVEITNGIHDELGVTHRNAYIGVSRDIVAGASFTFGNEVDRALVSTGQEYRDWNTRPARDSQDLLIGDHQGNHLQAGEGRDWLYGYGGDDTLRGGSGNDYLNGAHGNDYLEGGTGNDTVFAGQGNDSLWGEVGRDILYGNDGDDVLVGGRGEDTLWGEDGSDMLIGSDGDDYLDGGRGEDNLFGDWGDDYMDGGLDNDFLAGGGGDDEVFGYSGDDTLWGDAGDDTLWGDAGDDELYGGDGRDVLWGLWGNDRMEGGNQADRLYGYHQNDTLFGGDGSDTLYGGWGDDWLLGSDGWDLLDGEQGADRLFGGDGNDSLDGGDGNDTLAGNGDNDRLNGEDGNDSLYGGVGNDLLFGGGGADRLSGYDGTDLLFGNAGDDTMDGGRGNDILWGGEGSDTLDGGSGGMDHMIGGLGEDRFEFDSARGPWKMIHDFDSGFDSINFGAVKRSDGAIVHNGGRADTNDDGWITTADIGWDAWGAKGLMFHGLETDLYINVVDADLENAIRASDIL